MPERLKDKLLSTIAVCAIFFFFLFLFTRSGPAISFSTVTTSKTDLFTVTGEGKATAVPDIAKINLGITVNGSTVAQVQSQANSVINKVTAEIKKLGVGEKDIQTNSYNLRPDYDFTTPGTQRIKGYIIDINLLVKARQFDKINQIIDAATAAGANMVGGLSFTLDDATRVKVESQARTEAINKAKQKAAEIAKESGLTLGRIVNVSENTPIAIRPMPMMAKSADSGTSTPTQVEPGSSEITISVVLSYETR